MTRRVLSGVFLLTVVPLILTAQPPSTRAARAKSLAEAWQLGDLGKTAEARATVDSLIKSASPGASDIAELFFARATFAASAVDAGLDYRRIINDFASPARKKESLLRLAQQALISGERAKALDYLATRAREYADDSSLAVTGYWKARVLLESHDVSGACDALREAQMRDLNSPATVVADIEALALVSCGGAPSAGIVAGDPRPVRVAAATAKVKPATGAGSRVFAVQVAAFGNRNDAEAMSKRLRKKGLGAHVDGTRRPFRVRIGHFSSFAEAAKELRALKARGISGFVAEMTP